MTSRILSRTLVGAAATVALMVSAPMAASAHVTVSPNSAEPGSYTSVQFRVPNESDSAATVRVEIELPTDTPFLSVLYQPVPGWTVTVTDGILPEPVEVNGSIVTEAPVSITFEATGGGIAPGQFQNLTVSLGPVPEVGSIVLPAVQTYDDGTIAEWTATPEQLEADDTLSPAAVLYVTDAPVDHHGATTDAEHGEPHATTATSDESGAGLAVGLSIAGLVVAAGAAVLAAIAVSGRRKKVS